MKEKSRRIIRHAERSRSICSPGEHKGEESLRQAQDDGSKEMKNLLNEKRRMKNEKLHSETILNSSSVYRGRVEILRLVATVCTLVCTLAACAPDGIDDTHSNGQHDALEAMDPETAVRLRTTLQAFGGENTENKTRANDGSPDLAAIPAWNEVTAETVIGIGAEVRSAASGGIAEANASLYLPSATDNANYTLCPSGSDVTISNLGSETQWYNGSSDPFTLRLRHFNLKGKDAAGTRQPHSRLGILEINDNSYDDQLFAIASLNNGTDGNGATAPGFTFRLRHTTAKLSVLVNTSTGTELDMTTNGGVLADAYIRTKSTAGRPVYTGSNTGTGSSTPAHPDLLNYLTTANADGSYPDDPTEAEMGIAIYQIIEMRNAEGNYNCFPLRHPDATTGTSGITVPANLISGIVSASITHTEGNAGTDEDGYDIYAYSLLNADGTPERYSTSTAEADRDKDVLVLKLNNILDGGSGTESTTTATYRLPLSSIALTGLSADDPRCDTGGKYSGHLLYLRPGEHLTLTVTVDRNRIVSATGTIGTWSDATVDEDLTGDENKEPNE